MLNLDKMRTVSIALLSLVSGLLAGCNASNETASPSLRSDSHVETSHTDDPVSTDDPDSVAGLRSINAETKSTDGFMTFIDVSERDDITDDTFEYFSGLPNLKHLHAIYTPVSGTGLKHLADSVNLETLDLYACPITDESLANIVNLKNLRSLNLIGSKITDDSIETLSQFQSLDYLGIPKQISEAGRKRLAEKLPHSCEIDRFGT